MINLLSSEEKKKRLTEYRERIVVLSLFLLTLLCFIGIILTGSILALASVEEKINANKTARQSGNPAGENLTGLKEKMADLARKVEYAQKAPKLFHLSEAIELAMEKKTAGISFKSLVFNRDEKGNKINLAGKAADREQFLSFIEELKKDPSVISADYPTSALIKKSNIDFTVDISI